MIWSALFTVGNFLYGRIGYGAALAGVFVASGLVLLRVVTRLWSTKSEVETVPAVEI
jgi:1,4-dihydroxy-2-naphthoate octaprenyltransferase